MESGGDNPDYFQAGPNEAVRSVGSYASVDGDSFHVQAQGSFGVLTLEIATVARGGDCHVQAQGLLTT